MADVAKSVVIVFRGQGAKQLNKDMRTMETSAQRLNKALKSTPTARYQKNMKQITRANQNYAMSAQAGARSSMILRRALIAVSGALGFREILRTADAYTVLQNKLKVVARDQQNLNDLTEATYKIAQSTGAVWEDVSDVFIRTSSAVKTLGYTQRDVLKVTETLTKAIAVAGATSAEASRAMAQLVQGLTKNKLEWQDLRSVIEQIPYLAEQLAEGLGLKGGTKELIELASTGELTAQRLIQAFQKISPQIEIAWKKTTITVSSGLIQVRNSVTKYVGELDKMYGASDKIRKALTYLSDNIDTFARALGALSFTILPAAVRQLLALNAALIANPVGILVAGVLTAIGALVTFSDKIKISSDGVITLRDGFIALKNIAVQIFQKIAEAFSPIQNAIETGLFLFEKLQKLTEKIPLATTDVTSAFSAFSGFGAFVSLGSLAGTISEEARRVAEERVASSKSRRSVLDGLSGLDIPLGLPPQAPPAGDGRTSSVPGVSFEELFENLTREHELLKMTNSERQLALEIYNIETQLKRTVTESERERLTSLVEINQELERERQILEDIRGPQEQLIQTYEDLERMYRNGKISADEYRNALIKIEDAAESTADKLNNKLKGALENAKSDMYSFGITVNKWIESTIDRATEAIVKFAKTGKFNIKEFVLGAAEDLLRLSTKAFLMQLLGGAGGAGFALPGFATGGSFTVGGKGGGTDSRLVAFRATPGERVDVKTPGQQKAENSGNSGSTQNIRVINVIDPKESLSAMETGAGERVIMNVIERNPLMIRRILGNA